MIHSSEVTNNGSVHVCVSVYHLLLKRNSPSRTCPSVKTHCSSHQKKPLYSTTLWIQQRINHLNKLRLWTPVVHLNVVICKSMLNEKTKQSKAVHPSVMTMRDDGKTRKTQVFTTAEIRSVSTKEDCDHQREVTRIISKSVKSAHMYSYICDTRLIWRCMYDLPFLENTN